MVDSLLLGYVFLDTLLASVERHTVDAGSYISVVGIGHLSGSVDDAAHDANLEPLHVAGGLLDAGYGGAQVVEGAPAARAGDILGLADAQTRSLEYGKGGGGNVVGGDGALVHEPESVGESVNHERAHVGSGGELEGSLVVGVVHLGEDYRIGDSGSHHLMHQCTLVAGGVGMVGHSHDDHLGMGLEAGDILVGGGAILEHEKLDPARVHADEGHGVGGVYGADALQTRLAQGGQGVEVGDVHLLGVYLPGHGAADVDVVGALVGVGRLGHHAGDDHGHMGCADIGSSHGGAARRVEPVEARGLGSGDEAVAGAGGEVVDQLSGHGYLSLGLLGERHADGVADAVGKEGSDAHGTLDAAVLALTRLGHSEVERVVHVFAVELCHEQSHRLDHHHGVGRLDGDDHVVEVLPLADAQELHTTLDDTLGRVAVAVAYAVAQRTVVDADAYGCVVLPADVEEGHEAVFYLLQLLGVLLVGVLLMHKLAGRVDVVAGVDAHLLGIERGDVGYMRVEVDVGHERRLVAVGAYAGIDILEVLGFARALCGKTHQLSACLDDALGLGYAGSGVIGVGGGHRLDADRVVASHVDGTYVYH